MYSRWLAYSAIIFITIFSSCQKEYSCENCYEPPPTGDGNVVFYALSGCINDKAIQLKVDGNTYLIVNISFSPPDCSSPGTTRITLSPGIHSWEAICENGRTIAGGIIDVLPGGCQVELIK